MESKADWTQHKDLGSDPSGCSKDEGTEAGPRSARQRHCSASCRPSRRQRLPSLACRVRFLGAAAPASPRLGTSSRRLDKSWAWAKACKGAGAGCFAMRGTCVWDVPVEGSCTGGGGGAADVARPVLCFGRGGVGGVKAWLRCRARACAARWDWSSSATRPQGMSSLPSGCRPSGFPCTAWP